MKIRLFHSPYVDEAGVSRQRLCAFIEGINPDDDDDRDVVREIRDALAKCEREATVLAVDSSIAVEWL